MNSIKKYKINLLFIIRKIFLQFIKYCILELEILNSSLDNEIKFIFYLLIYKNRFSIFFINEIN